MRKRIILSLLILILFIPVFGASAADDYVETSVTVDESVTVQQSDKRLLGFNDDTWSQSAFTVGHSTAENPAFEDAINTTGMPIYISRRAGGISQVFRWKDSIGKIEERGFHPQTGERLTYGLVEWIQQTKNLQKDARLIFNLNMIDDTAQDHADLIRFLYLSPDDEKAVDENGVNWAQKRVECGLLEPVELEVVELGNEIDWYFYDEYESEADVQARVEWYVAESKAAIQAMRAVKPDLKIAAIMYTTPSDGLGWADVWNSYVIQELGPLVEYVDFHHYINGIEGGSNNYHVNTVHLDQEICRYINLLPAENRPRIFISEYAVWVGSEQTTMKKKGTTSIVGAVDIGKFIIQMANRGDVDIMTYHSLIDNKSTMTSWSNGWAAVREFDDGNYYVTGAGEAIKTLGHGFGDGATGENIVKTTVDKVNATSLYGEPHNKLYAEDSDEDILVAAASTTAEGGLKLMISNTSLYMGHKITFSAKQQYKLAKEYVLSARDPRTDNNPETPDALYCQVNRINDETAFAQYTVEPNTLVVLDLIPVDAVHRENELEINLTGADTDGVLRTQNGACSVLVQGYHNLDTASMENVTVAVFPAEAQEDAANSLYFETKSVRRELAKFDIILGEDAPNGDYTVLVTTSINGVEYTERIGLTLERDLQSKMISAASVQPDAQNPYLLHTEVYSANDLSVGMEYLCETVFENTVITVQTVTKQAGKDTFDILMPLDAYQGEYTLRLTCPNDRTVFEKTFVFQKTDEAISLSETISNGAQPLTMATLTDTAYVTATNNTATPLSADILFAVYDKTGKLINVYETSNNSFAGGESKKIPVNLGDIADTVNCIRVLIWDTADMAAYSHVYHIK